MVKDCGVDFVEIGHSERRAMFGETDFTVNKKARAALEHGLMPLICVGDSAAQKAYGVSRESVVRQVKIALNGINASCMDRVIIAHEPVWAIGDNGVSAEPGYVNRIHTAIRQEIAAL